MSVMVTGASGRLGRLVAGALLEWVPAGLILVSRTTDRLEKFAERSDAAIDVVDQ